MSETHDHETIFLDCPHKEERMWAEDNPFEPCEVPGCTGPVEFIRMDLHKRAVTDAGKEGNE